MLKSREKSELRGVSRRSWRWGKVKGINVLDPKCSKTKVYGRAGHGENA